jgi:hypothetical protein
MHTGSGTWRWGFTSTFFFYFPGHIPHGLGTKLFFYSYILVYLLISDVLCTVAPPSGALLDVTWFGACALVLTCLVLCRRYFNLCCVVWQVLGSKWSISLGVEFTLGDWLFLRRNNNNCQSFANLPQRIQVLWLVLCCVVGAWLDTWIISLGVEFRLGASLDTRSISLGVEFTLGDWLFLRKNNKNCQSFANLPQRIHEFNKTKFLFSKIIRF